MGYLSFEDDIGFPNNTATLGKRSESVAVPANHFSLSPADGTPRRQERSPGASLICAISLSRMTAVHDCGPGLESEAN